jgi:hypothetical protein
VENLFNDRWNIPVKEQKGLHGQAGMTRAFDLCEIDNLWNPCRAIQRENEKNWEKEKFFFTSSHYYAKMLK